MLLWASLEFGWVLDRPRQFGQLLLQLLPHELDSIAKFGFEEEVFQIFQGRIVVETLHGISMVMPS